MRVEQKLISLGITLPPGVTSWLLFFLFLTFLFHWISFSFTMTFGKHARKWVKTVAFFNYLRYTCS